MKIKLFCVLLILATFGCAKNGNAPTENAETLTVSAAISLKDAFDEIGTIYREKSGVKVNFNYGASGALQRQIENGAPADVFASAGERQMDELEKNGLIVSDSRRVFARNSLVFIFPKNSKLNFGTFEDLKSGEIKKIAVGNPKTVPAGQYAEEVLTNMNLKTEVQNKLVYAENVRQVLNYVVRGEADVGIVYLTDSLTAKGDVITIVPRNIEKNHSPILYPSAVVAGSQKQQKAREFIEFVLGERGQLILQKYGFQIITAK